MKILRYGMIGCGMMGQEHIRNIQLLPDTEIVAIFEPDATMREAAAGLVPKVEFAPDIDALLARTDLDCLVIASPNHVHAAQLERISQGPAIPILCEKPLITRSQDQSLIAKLQTHYSAPVWVAMEYRYMPPVAAFIEQAQSVTGGIKMLTIREHRFPFLEKVGDWNRFNENSGGTLVEKCCHFFDLMRLIIGSKPVRVMASAGQAVNHLDERYDGRTPDIWDHGYVIVDFECGARAMLELCMFADGAEYQEEISAIGPSGKIECLVPGPGRFWPKHLGEPPVPKLIVSPREPRGPISVDIPVDTNLLEAGDHNGSTFYQHQLFHSVARGQGQPEVNLQDGLDAVLLAMAAQKSAETGQSVSL